MIFYREEPITMDLIVSTIKEINDEFFEGLMPIEHGQNYIDILKTNNPRLELCYEDIPFKHFYDKSTGEEGEILEDGFYYKEVGNAFVEFKIKGSTTFFNWVCWTFLKLLSEKLNGEIYSDGDVDRPYIIDKTYGEFIYRLYATSIGEEEISDKFREILKYEKEKLLEPYIPSNVLDRFVKELPIGLFEQNHIKTWEEFNI